MSTRGFVGIKQGKVISGYYNHSDSYYSYLGKAVLDAYFAGKRIIDTIDEDDEKFETSKNGKFIFLYDGLFCENGYLYNEDNDTLEIYRSFFLKPQIFKKGHKSSYDNDIRYTHLVTVIDKKIHTKQQAYECLEHYDKVSQEEEKVEINEDYPERDIINVCNNCYVNIPVKEEFCSDKCKHKYVAKQL